MRARGAFLLPGTLGLAFFLMGGAAQAVTITETKVPPFGGLCRAYTIELGPNYSAAVTDIFSAIFTSNMAKQGNPEVIFGTPIKPEDDPAKILAWSICVPVYVPAGSAAPSPYTLGQIPETSAIEAICENSDMGRKQCSSDILAYLQQKGLLVAWLRSSSAIDDKSFKVIVPIALPPPAPNAR